jgi:hypothetical protein
LREEYFAGGKKGGFSLSNNQFLTFCELTDTHCAVLVHVPELRRFSTDAMNSLGELAWVSAQAALQNHAAGKPGMSLAVGMRGAIIYDRVLLGSDQPGETYEPASLVETVTGSRNRERLYQYFRPQTISSSTGQPNP